MDTKSCFIQIIDQLNVLSLSIQRIEKRLDEQTAHEKAFLSAAEAADLIAVSVKSLYRYTRLGMISYHKPGNGRLLYERTEVIKFIKSRPILKLDEIREEARLRRNRKNG